MLDGVIWNSKFFDPKVPGIKQMSPAASVLYAATREGAHLISPEEERQMEMKNNFQYISKRKGVEHVDGERDGLFNAFGKADLAFECNQAAQSEAIFWKNVLSLSKEDADRLGYTNVDAFRQLLARRMPEVAREYNISPQNLVWVAAYHPIDKNGSDHHPHVHVYFYSKDPSEGRMSPERTVKAFEKCRSLFTNDVFADDAALLKEQRTLTRDELRNTLREYRFESEAAEKLGLQEDLRQLARELPTEGRKGSYKYLKPDIKEKVDSILQKTVQLPGVDQAYQAYRDAYLAQVKLYHSDDQAINKRMEAFDKEFFHPTKANSRRDFHNAILNTARSLGGIDVELAGREVTKPSEELKHFVGLSAREAVMTAQTDNGYRMWLAQLASEYSMSELPGLLNRAQKENWRELYRTVRSAMDDNPQLRDMLTSECRMFLNADEQEHGIYIQGDRLYQTNVSEETAGGVRAEVQRLLHSTRHVTNDAEDYVTRLFYENALDRRVQGWFRSHEDVCSGLRKCMGAVRYRVDDKRHPCPKAVSDAAYAAASELLIRIANEDPALRKERDLFMMRSLKQIDSFDGMDRLMNAALNSAYQQELNVVFSDVLRERSKNEDLFNEIKKTATVDGELPADLQMKVQSLVEATASVSIDDRGRNNLTGRLSRMLHDERLGEELAQAHAKEWDDLKGRVALRSDAVKLLEDKGILEALKPLEQAVTEKIPRERLQRLLLAQAYSENLSGQMQAFYKQLPERREEITLLSDQVRCGITLDSLSSEQLRQLSVFLPTVSMDARTRELFHNRALSVVEEEHLRRVLSLPQGILDRVCDSVGMRQDIVALQRDPRLQRMLDPVKMVVQRNPEVAAASGTMLDRVLLQQACKDNRRAFVETLYTSEARALFAPVAQNVYIGQPLESLPLDIQQRFGQFFGGCYDKKGYDMMRREIEKRLYNERFRALAQSDEVRRGLKEYLRDPHHRSLIDRGVTFDELTPAERASISQARSGIDNQEIRSYAADHAEDMDRAFYRAAQQHHHEGVHVERGVRGLLGGLTVAASIARSMKMMSAENQRTQESQERQGSQKRKTKNPKKKHSKQEPSKQEDIMQP